MTETRKQKKFENDFIMSFYLRITSHNSKKNKQL